MGINKQLRRTGTIVDEIGNLDAFGRLRTSDAVTLFDTKRNQHTNPLIWLDEAVGGGLGLYLDTIPGFVLLALAPGQSFTHQSRMYTNYQPGKSQLIYITAGLFPAVTGSTKRLGIFDDGNGIFFQQNEDGTLAVGIRSDEVFNPGDDLTQQADFNGEVDLTKIDITRTHIFVIDFEWLGAGRVRWGLVLDGKFKLLHERTAANFIDGAYMKTPNLPVRYEIETTGAGAVLNAVCATVITEARTEDTGLEFSALNRTPLASAPAGTLTPLVSVRLAQNAIDIRKLIRLMKFSAAYVTGNNVSFELWLNSGLTGAAFTANKATQSYAEVDVAATAIDETGTLLAAEVCSGDVRTVNACLKNAGHFLAANFAGDTSDVVTLAARSIGGAATDVTGTITFKELS